MAGEITGWDADKLRNGSSWYGEPDDMAHMKMCKKTVLKQLLNDGFAPKEIDLVLRQDDAEEQSGEPIIRPEDIVATFAAAPVPAKDDGETEEAETGERIAAAPQAPRNDNGDEGRGLPRAAGGPRNDSGEGEERIAAVPSEPRNDREEAPKRRGRPPKDAGSAEIADRRYGDGGNAESMAINDRRYNGNGESREQAFSMFDEG